ncbi:hypothetical protein GCM10027161_42280 [Microbispora hainanensis]
MEPDRTGDMTNTGATRRRSARGSAGGRTSSSGAAGGAGLAGDDDWAAGRTRVSWTPVNLTSAPLILRCHVMARDTTGASGEIPENPPPAHL